MPPRGGEQMKIAAVPPAPDIHVNARITSPGVVWLVPVLARFFLLYT